VSGVLARAAAPPRGGAGRLAVAGVIVGCAVLAGLAAGDPSRQWFVLFSGVCGAAVLYGAARWPYEALLVMIASTIQLVVVMVNASRGLNAIDVLLPPAFLASACGVARRDALVHARSERGPLHARLYVAERRFTHAVLLYFGFAALSLVRLATLAGVPAAIDSSFNLARVCEGLMLFPLCTWWLRTRKRVEGGWDAIFAAGVLLATANVIGVTAMHLKRASMTFTVNNPDHFSDPNEAGVATLFVFVALLIRHAMQPRWTNILLGGVMIVILGLTQSRSGMLAWLMFAALTLRWVKPSRLFAGGLAVAALLALMPHGFWIRMARSIGQQRGTNEAVSFFQRVYGWQTAWRTFLDQPLGVGYLGFRFVSHNYNQLHLIVSTVENYFYETLVSLGPIGLALLVIAIVRLFQLGREVGRVAPPGTLAHHMARFHRPLLLGLLVANLTGDNFAGLVTIGQLAVWSAILVRAGHAAVAEASA